MWHRGQWRLFSTQTLRMLLSVFVSVCVIPEEASRRQTLAIYVFMIYQQMLVKKISGCTYMQYYHRCVHKITAASETSAHKASTNRGRTFSSVSALITLIRPHRELLSLQGREHTSSILTTSNSYFNAFQYIASSPLFHSNPSYLIYYVPNSTINPINCSIVVNRSVLQVFCKTCTSWMSIVEVGSRKSHRLL